MDSFVALTNFDEEKYPAFAVRQKESKVKGDHQNQPFAAERSDSQSGSGQRGLSAVSEPRKRSCSMSAPLRIPWTATSKRCTGCFDDRVEALEFNIQKESKITGVPLEQLNLRKNLLVCSIIRDNRMITPQRTGCHFARRHYHRGHHRPWPERCPGYPGAVGGDLS